MEGCQDSCLVDKPFAYRGPLHMRSVTIHRFCRQLHVVEHALKFLRELVTALDFQLAQHLSFRVVRDGPSQQQSFGKVPFIIALEHVLVGKIPEHRDGLVQCNIDFEIGFL